LFIPYYGTLSNYFQLYLDSLEINTDLLTVFFITDIDLSSYKLPQNLIHIRMEIGELKNRLSSFIYKTYDKYVHPDSLLKFIYKLVDIKIIYPLLFSDYIKDYNIKDTDYIGWGDCDLIYGKLSNFINVNENYGMIGGWNGHFTAFLNNDSFKNIFLGIPNYLNLITDNSRHYGTDEIAYREPLKSYLFNNKVKAFSMNKYFCDVIPPCFFHLSRPDHKDYDINFYDLYDPKKNIKHIHFDKTNSKLTVVYEDGERRETTYAHLQKRKMDLQFNSYDDEFFILEHSFCKTA
jgi:hypothetical protein